MQASNSYRGFESNAIRHPAQRISLDLTVGSLLRGANVRQEHRPASNGFIGG
jgi:hypothetical protein